jgi:nucleoside-triphosphatase
VAETMVKRVFLLTGAPGVGKTTVLQKTVELVRAQGVEVGGMVSLEARRNGIRVGFEIIDLQDGSRGWLAHVNGIGASVGKYHVKLPDLENVGVKAINDAMERCQVVAIDEIGPMELYSKPFKQAVMRVLESKKVVLSVVHAKAKDPLVTQVKQRVDAEIFNVTFVNRENLPEHLTQKALNLL